MIFDSNINWMTDIKTVHILVDGHVQGVGFRFFVQQVAQELSLTGWVRNRHDDRVEILAQGEEANLFRLIEMVRLGPPSATVTSVETDWLLEAIQYTRFSIAPTN